MIVRLTEKLEGGGSSSRNVDEVPSATDLRDGSTVHLTTWDIDVTFTARQGRWVQDSLDGDIQLEPLLAKTIVEARRRRDHPQAREDGSIRQLSLVVTKLEEAALWLCEQRARDHVGEDALIDWLQEII